jgi:hypothetical protein
MERWIYDYCAGCKSIGRRPFEAALQQQQAAAQRGRMFFRSFSVPSFVEAPKFSMKV